MTAFSYKMTRRRLVHPSSPTSNLRNDDRSTQPQKSQERGKTKQQIGVAVNGMMIVTILIFCSAFVGILYNRSSALDDNEGRSGSSFSRSKAFGGRNQCLLYLAPSSIPQAGYGIYTVQDAPKGTTILPNDGPNIAVPDPTFFLPRRTRPGANWDMFDNVWWGAMSGMSDHMRYEADDVYDFQITFGALPNYHPYSSNLDNKNPVNTLYDDSMARPVSDPGAGAFTYYAGKEFRAWKDVKAGQELFLDYGEGFLSSRPKDFGHVARRRDYHHAAELLMIFPEHLKALAESSSERSHSLAKKSEKILAKIQKEIAEEDFGVRVLSILPKTAQDLERVVKAAESVTDRKHLADAIASEISVLKRDIPWIRQNGMCLDNIVPGPSTIPGAGRGAIAQRRLKKGELIVPVPTLHLIDRDILKTRTVLPVWDKKRNSASIAQLENDPKSVDDANTNMQLLLNYCFGHHESSLLLCPITNAILINHCSRRRQRVGASNCPGPNAMYRWAGSWDPKTSESLKQPLKELGKSRLERKVSLEIVALRDIKPGEEIFIDYGKRWERAWQDHVKAWTAPDDNSVLWKYHSEVGMNQQKVLGVTGKLRDDEAPELVNLFVSCWYFPSDDVDQQEDEEKEKSAEEKDKWIRNKWKEYTDNEIIDHYGVDGSEYPIPNQGDFGEYWPCSIVRVDDAEHDEEDEREGDAGGQSYTVRIYQSKFHDETKWTAKGEPRIIKNFPREAINFMTLPYRSDQHLPNTFRHHIEIHDDMFPPQWRNRK